MDRSSTITFRTEGTFTCSSCHLQEDNVVGSINNNREEFSSDTWTSIAVQCQGCSKWFIKCRHCDSSSPYSASSMEFAYRNNYTRFNREHERCCEASLLSGTAANHDEVNDDNFFEQMKMHSMILVQIMHRKHPPLTPLILMHLSTTLHHLRICIKTTPILTKSTTD